MDADTELERFFSLSLDFLCIASADGYFKRVNPAVTDILGWSVEEFLAIPYIELVHPDDVQATLAAVDRQMVAGQKILEFENRYRHRNGSYRVLSWRSMPQPDGLMYAVARDVSERKRDEVALRESHALLETRVTLRAGDLARVNESLQLSERRFRALLEHSGDGIALIDADNKILYLSPAVTAIEGYAPEELLGHSGVEHTHPDDLPLVQEVVAKLVANPGKPIPALWRRRHKDGRWLWLEGTGTNLLDDPAVRGIVTNYRDVTGRKLAEARQQLQLVRLALLSQITRAIGERQDTQSIFQVVVGTLEAELSVQFSCICLYDPVTQTLTVAGLGAVSTPLAVTLAMTHGAQIPIDQNALSRCVQGHLVYESQIDQVPFPFPQRLAAGGLRSMVVAPLRVESQVFGVLIVARREADSFSSADCEFLLQLSEHVALAAHQAQLYQALQQAYDDLRQTQQTVLQQERLRALGQLASGIAHDINNAISPVMLYTESLLEREPGLSERARGQLQTIQRAIGDVALTVARMREFYRQREPQMALAPVDLSGLAQHVIELTRPIWSDMAHHRGVSIELQTELAPQLPQVMGIENEIRDALGNLVFNAVDAMPQGGTLRVRSGLRREGRQVYVEIGDTGIGMDEDTRRRCLEPFFTTKGERGTGLGLAMVYGMVQRHGGEIEIDSALGQGTAIRLCFEVPVELTDTARQRAMTPIMPGALQILIIDDDPMLLRSLCDILESDGHTVTAAGGGQAGIDAFGLARQQGDPFDVVITDLGMPQLDGRRVAGAIKALDPSLPVILMTGWGQRIVSEGDIPPHVDRVLSKPPRLKELREALAQLTAP